MGRISYKIIAWLGVFLIFSVCFLLVFRESRQRLHKQKPSALKETQGGHVCIIKEFKQKPPAVKFFKIRPLRYYPRIHVPGIALDANWLEWWCSRLHIRSAHYDPWVVGSQKAKEKVEDFVEIIDRPTLAIPKWFNWQPSVPRFKTAEDQFIYALKVWSFTFGREANPAKFRTAANAFKAVLTNFPRHRKICSYAQLGLGLTLGGESESDYANLKELRKVIQVYPTFRERCMKAQFYIAQVLFSRKKLREARKAYQAVVRNYSDLRYLLDLEYRKSDVRGFHFTDLELEKLYLRAPYSSDWFWGLKRNVK